MSGESAPVSSAPAEPGPNAWTRRLRRFWPLAAACVLVLVAVVTVYALLRPRPYASAPGGPERSPASVTMDSIALRGEPSREGKIEKTLAQNTRVTVTDNRGAWVEVEADGARGFLPAEAVERDADRDARQRRAKTVLAFPPVYGVVGEDTDVSLAPYPLAPRGGRLARGTVIEIHSVDHSYFAFKDEKWGLAYASSAQVDLVPRDPRQPAVTPEKVRPLKDLTIVNLNEEPPEEAPMETEPPEPSGNPPSVPAPAPPGKESLPGLVEPATILTSVEPQYPDLPRRAGIEGTVELEVSIDAKGKVTDVEVVRGLPLGLSDAAADAVRKWTFRPARGPEGPIASRKTVRIRFALGPPAAP
jgi:TonB family protein